MPSQQTCAIQLSTPRENYIYLSACSNVLAVGYVRCGAGPGFRRFRRDWIIVCSLNSSTISSGELTCTPNAFRLVERTNRKAGIMQRSTIAVRPISKCYNERPVIYLARIIHTSSSRYRRYLWQKLARFYTNIAWNQMLGTCGLSGPCSHELAYVYLAVCVILRTHFALRAYLILSAVFVY